jgi:dTDP-3,4-didehydro-2,6-dideoxy-alpha-D-glucose 3-reductase
MTEPNGRALVKSPPTTDSTDVLRDPMRVAVWGLGRHAIDKILPAVSAAEGLHLYGVCSRNPRSVADSAAAWNCRGWTEPASMLRDPQVQIVYVATPIGLHAEHGRAALAAGKHVWCEKPLTSRLEDSLELLQLSRALGLSVREGHMYLHHPQFLWLSKCLSDGRLGRVLSVWCGFGIPRLASPGFRSDASLGGGALLDVGCYPISAIQALFPDHARTVRYSMISARDGSPVDTDGYCLIEVANGVEATLEWRINSSYRNQIDIWGEGGSLSTDRVFSKPADHVPAFRIRDTHGVETVEYGAPANQYVLMLETFRRSVGDTIALEMERRAIADRAQLLDEVRSTSSGRSGGYV